jgi:hypothetical protein
VKKVELYIHLIKINYIIIRNQNPDFMNIGIPISGNLVKSQNMSLIIKILQLRWGRDCDEFINVQRHAIN